MVSYKLDTTNDLLTSRAGFGHLGSQPQIQAAWARCISGNEIVADADGLPILDKQLFLLATRLPEGRAGVKPFRFILNYSSATACNMFLMLYPKAVLAQVLADDPGIMRAIWIFLTEIDPEELPGHGRVYGDGLHKPEPKELRGFPATDLIERLSNMELLHRQLNLLDTAA